MASISVLHTDGIFERVHTELAFIDLRSLFATCQKLRSDVLSLISTWPTAVQEHFWSWPQRGSNILVFGNHHTRPIVPQHVYDDRMPSKFLNPSPILRFCFDHVAFDVLTGRLTGNPWSELVQANTPPQGHGRIGPGVCLLDTSVFYCGGRMIADSNEYVCGFNRNTSSVAMMFELETRMWRRLPDMPTSKSAAGVCRVGNQVLVMCGETFRGCRRYPSSSIFLFDLVHERWTEEEEHGIPPFPGSSEADFTILQDKEEEVFVAGGTFKFSEPGWGEVEYESRYSEDGSHEIVTCAVREVFHLSLSSRIWTSLPELPIEYHTGRFGEKLMDENKSKANGVVFLKSCGVSHQQIGTLCNTGTKFKIGMFGHDNSLWQFTEGSNAWERSRKISLNEFESRQDSMSICNYELIAKEGLMITFLSNDHGGFLYAQNTKKLTALPWKPSPVQRYWGGSQGMMVEQANGDFFEMELENASSALNVRLK